MRLALLILLCALRLGAQTAIVTLEANSEVGVNQVPSFWVLEEKSGNLWTNRGTIAVQTIGQTNAQGLLVISNVTVGLHTYRATQNRLGRLGPPSAPASTNIVVPYLVVDVQVSSSPTGPWTNYATITPPPVPGRDLSASFVRGVLRIQK